MSTCDGKILAAGPDSPVAWEVVSDSAQPHEVYLLDVGAGRTVAIVVTGDTQLAAQIVDLFEFSA